jgi:hypothetical protein
MPRTMSLKQPLFPHARHTGITHETGGELWNKEDRDRKAKGCDGHHK